MYVLRTQRNFVDALSRTVTSYTIFASCNSTLDAAYSIPNSLRSSAHDTSRSIGYERRGGTCGGTFSSFS